MTCWRDDMLMPRHRNMIALWHDDVRALCYNKYNDMMIPKHVDAHQIERIKHIHTNTTNSSHTAPQTNTQ